MGEDTRDVAISREAAERQAPGSHVVHEAIVAEGIEELARSTPALAWSALAGGLSMGFSLLGEAGLHAWLPDAPWRPLVAKLGYAIGFIIVILGRQQLFTENTLTPILPLLQHKRRVGVGDVARLWLTVLLGNLVGAVAFAVAVTRTDLLSAELRGTITVIGREAFAPAFALIVLRGIFAGWLIALLVWLLPAAETARIWVILIVTWLIGICGFSHVIAGGTEVFALASAGEIAWGAAVGQFIVPALLGNIIGGIALVAALNHAQVTAGEPESATKPGRGMSDRVREG
jgi:formate-nitrite transporter family protein